MSSLLTGDCLEVMAGMEPDSVDAIVTDPPSGIGFMNRSWDHDRGGRAQWVAWMTSVMEAAYRVLKPGHWALVWSLPRTSHWTAWAIEDAGFRITDQIHHVFASGFPKGRGQLKPAYEPWILAKKPGPLVPLGIDAARIGTAEDVPATTQGLGARPDGEQMYGNGKGFRTERREFVPTAGRWPANLVLTDPIFDGDTPGVVGGGDSDGMKRATLNRGATTGSGLGYGSTGSVHTAEDVGYSDEGTYSRYFLIPKGSRQDREPNAYGRMVGGLEESGSVRVESAHSTVCAKCGRQRVNVPGAACKCAEPDWVRKPQTARLNSHPTSKPTALMRHLVRLVTPPGGRVLDMFAGSGSTLIAAELEGFAWTGIEQEPEYVAIAEARLAGVQRGLGLDVAAPTPKAGKGGGKATGYDWSESVNDNPTHVTRNIKSGVHFGDTGTPSRFFLLPRDPADVA